MNQNCANVLALYIGIKFLIQYAQTSDINSSDTDCTFVIWSLSIIALLLVNEIQGL